MAKTYQCNFHLFVCSCNGGDIPNSRKTQFRPGKGEQKVRCKNLSDLPKHMLASTSQNMSLIFLDLFPKFGTPQDASRKNSVEICLQSFRITFGHCLRMQMFPQFWMCPSGCIPVTMVDMYGSACSIRTVQLNLPRCFLFQHISTLCCFLE